MIDPTEVRLSSHFLLSDFLGNHSVYSRGLPNVYEGSGDSDDIRMRNAHALTNYGLELILAQFGPLSVSYGFISPALSKEIVKYQDPDKPSHHRWDLGAAADIVSHDWVQGGYLTEWHTYDHAAAANSPITLAHEIDRMDVAYSRIITYSESPYICVALSDEEIANSQPRKAFYENRFMGKAKVKPKYISLATEAARERHFADLVKSGLPVNWEGAGYPTYHGGGREQYHHMRVSRYTMVSDFLFDLQSIANGKKNVPSLNDDRVQDAFAAAGLVYDALITGTNMRRLSITKGYVSHLNPYSEPENDWRGNSIMFEVAAPDDEDRLEDMREALGMHYDPNYVLVYPIDDRPGRYVIDLQVDYVLAI